MTLCQILIFSYVDYCPFGSAYSTMAGSGLYFVAMNYAVHALMYGYYCLQALKVCPKSFPAVLITISQIAQMFVGTGVCISAWYFKFSGRSCSNEDSNLILGALMYGSYLYLFCEFAVKRYLFPNSASKSSKSSGGKKVAFGNASTAPSSDCCSKKSD